MAPVIRPWQVLVVATAGWISRHQDEVIEYLREENRVLKQQLGGRRLRLAAKGKALGYRVLSEVATIVTPDTILRWHRRLIAEKWDYSAKRSDPGQPLMGGSRSNHFNLIQYLLEFGLAKPLPRRSLPAPAIFWAVRARYEVDGNPRLPSGTPQSH